LYLSLARRAPSYWVAGLFWGLAILGHLTNVLLAVPLVVYCATTGGAAWRKRYAILVLAAAGLAGSAYGIVAFGLVRVGSAPGFLDWILSWAATHPAYGVSRLEQFALARISHRKN